MTSKKSLASMSVLDLDPIPFSIEETQTDNRASNNEPTI